MPALQGHEACEASGQTSASPKVVTEETEPGAWFAPK